MIKNYKEKNVYGKNYELIVRLTWFSFLLFTLFLFAGCNGANNSGPATPSSVVKTYFSALKNGDQQTIQSIKLDGEGVSPLAVGAARKLAKQRGSLTCSETIKGDTAVVIATFGNKEIINFILKKVDGQWKIDIMVNEQLAPLETILPDEFKEK